MTDTSSPNLELIATRRHFRGEGFLPKDAFLERIAATLERIDEKVGLLSINKHDITIKNPDIQSNREIDIDKDLLSWDDLYGKKRNWES